MTTIESFLEVSDPNVIVSILKKAEDGKGVIVRCYETDGKNSAITLNGLENIRSAARVNIIEDKLDNDSFPIRTNNIKDNKVQDIHIGKFAIETLRITYK